MKLSTPSDYFKVKNTSAEMKNLPGQIEPTILQQNARLT